MLYLHAGEFVLERGSILHTESVWLSTELLSHFPQIAVGQRSVLVLCRVACRSEYSVLYWILHTMPNADISNSFITSHNST